jgi:hypothetical protein
MRKHYEELFVSAVNELKFKNMQVDMLVWELRFIKEATNDDLASRTIDVVLQRKITDDLFHYRKIWNLQKNNLKDLWTDTKKDIEK